MKSMHMVMINLIPSMRTGVILKEAMNQNSQKRILLRDHKNKTIQCLSQINVACTFIGFYCSYFPGSLDFLLDSAMEMLLKFLSRFFWLVGTFNEDSFNSQGSHGPGILLEKLLGP